MSALELIEQLETLAQKATPGPWEFVARTGLRDYDAVFTAAGIVMDGHWTSPTAVTAADQALCAALVTALPALAEFVRAYTWRGLDTLPEAGVVVLVWLQHPNGSTWTGTARRGRDYVEGRWTTNSGDVYASHWMPLPEGPNG